LKGVVDNFSAQDYTGSKQLVIINDNPNYFYFTKRPYIKIVNFPFRFPYLKLKSNISVYYCDGEFCVWWADDDKYESWALSVIAKYLKRDDNCLALYPYYKCMPDIEPSKIEGAENDMCIVKKSYWLQTGGYDVYEKTNYSFIRKAKDSGNYRTCRMNDDEIYFHWMCRRGRKDIWKPSPKEDYIYNPDRKPPEKIEL